MTTETLPHGTLLLQDRRFLKLSVDAILLAAACPPSHRVCDLGCGVGNVLLSVADRQPDCRIVGLEINHEAAEVCRQSVALNHLEHRVIVVDGDLRAISGDGLPYGLKPHSFDCVVCNPPYLREGGGKPSPDPVKNLERVDATAKPWEVVAAAGALLRDGGTLTLVLRPDRLDEYLDAAGRCGFSPVGIADVRPDESSPPALVLLMAVLGKAAGALEQRTIYLNSDEYKAILKGAPICLSST